MTDHNSLEQLTVYQYNGLCLIPEIQRFEICGRLLKLPPKLFHIMHLFMSNPQRVFRKHEIIEWIGLQENIEYDVLEVSLLKSIDRLRIALFPKNRKFANEVILRVPCVGYRLGDFRKIVRTY